MTPAEIIEIILEGEGVPEFPVARIITALRRGGFEVVPREPTEAMISAGYWQLPGDFFYRPREPAEAWAAMLAAAGTEP
jgi:hypothetical protein